MNFLVLFIIELSCFVAFKIDIFSFRVPCCDVHYDFRIKTRFGSSLPPVVCKRDYLFCIL